MKRFIKNFFIILIAVLGFSALISAGSLWSLRNSSFYKPSFLVNDIQEASFDYIILGASIGLTTLNTNVIDSISHLRGLNLSMDDTSLASHYLMLEHFLAEGKKTDYCILASSNTSYDQRKNYLSSNDYRFLPFVKRAYVYGHFQQYHSNQAKILAYSNILPMLGVSYYNAEVFYPSLRSFIYPKKRNRYDSKGNYKYPVKNNEDAIITIKDTFEVDFSNPSMKSIKDLCDRHGIQLICYLTPMKERSVKVVNDEFIVINHSDSLIRTRFFFDGIHVNSLGREASSVAFAKEFINEKFNR